MDQLDLSTIKVDRSDNPLQLYWAGPNSPVELRTFYHFTDWRDFIANLCLNRRVTQVVSQKYRRAQRLFMLAWIEVDVIKAGELAALAALELALKDVYPDVYQRKDKKGNPIRAYLKDGLTHMVKHDGLTDEKLPIFQKYGACVVANLYRDKGDQTGTVYGLRNSLAHGDPFDGLPFASLLEVVRDVIDYLYRDRSTSHE